VLQRVRRKQPEGEQRGEDGHPDERVALPVRGEPAAANLDPDAFLDLVRVPVA
jgi:hypothetical protein